MRVCVLDAVCAASKRGKRNEKEPSVQHGPLLLLALRREPARDKVRGGQGWCGSACCCAAVRVGVRACKPSAWAQHPRSARQLCEQAAVAAATPATAAATAAACAAAAVWRASGEARQWRPPAHLPVRQQHPQQQQYRQLPGAMRSRSWGAAQHASLRCVGGQPMHARTHARTRACTRMPPRNARQQHDRPLARGSSSIAAASATRTATTTTRRRQHGSPPGPVLPPAEGQAVPQVPLLPRRARPQDPHL